MRTIFSLISLLCIIISGLLIISIPFVGLFKVFSLFPEWVYVILFLGVVIPYLAKEDAKAEALKKQLQERNNAVVNPIEIAKVNAKPNEPEVVSKSEIFPQPPTRSDARVVHLTIQPVKGTDMISEILCTNPFIVAADDNGSLIGEYEERGINKVYIKLCQQKKKLDVLNGTEEILNMRYAYLTGTMEELSELVSKHSLSIGSQIAGRIILVESLFKSWKGQKAKVDEKTGNTVGFTFEDRFYPVYARYHFTEDVNARDDELNYFKAKYCFRDYDLKPGDILPSFV
jgi:hypothetical protein